MKTFKKLQQVQESITQLIVCYIKIFHNLEYFIKHYKMIAKDLSEQQALDADPKAVQQMNFTANLDDNKKILLFFIIKNLKETLLDFSQRTVKVLSISSNDLAWVTRVAKVSDLKVFEHTPCSQFDFALI